MVEEAETGTWTDRLTDLSQNCSLSTLIAYDAMN